jgi:acetylornithine deacetylase/succinyl-diaminopimelate desuccinylase-like protein
VTSRYDPATDHCYAELDDSDHAEIDLRLYDAQTGEILANTFEKGHQTGGIIFGPKSDGTFHHYDEAISYINKLMSEDRGRR